MTRIFHCSFCGASQHEVEVMLAGPVNVFICSGCVETAVFEVEKKRREMKFFADVARCAWCQPEPIHV